MLAHIVIAATLAFRRAGKAQRDLIDAPPALRKAQRQHIRRFAGKGIAGTHSPLPVYRKGASSRAAANALFGRCPGGWQVGQAIRVVPQLNPPAGKRLLELQHGDVGLHICIHRPAARFLPGSH